MKLSDLFEQKWYDDSGEIRLYHGTTSALIDIIHEHGLQPPQTQLDEYAFEILERYIPRSDWDEKLIRGVHEHAARMGGGRSGDRGQVIYCMTDFEGPAGYARGHAQYGGEIAKDVYELACMHITGQTHDLDELSVRDYREMPRPLPVPYPEGYGVVVEILVPKAWCIFPNNLEQMKLNIQQARAEGRKWATEGTLEDAYDEIFERREVRIPKTVPPSMILDIHRA